jgi:hypothetical protein
VALRFFLRITLGRTEHLERIPVLREAKRLAMTVLCRLGVHSRPFATAAP